MKFSKILFFVLIGAVSLEASATFKVTDCWKGFSSAEQATNLMNCQRQRQEGQKCSASFFEHQQAVYDVCLMASDGPLKVVSVFKGTSQRDQDANLSACKLQEGPGTVCVSNAWIHGQGVYDVALMSSEEAPTVSTSP